MYTPHRLSINPPFNDAQRAHLRTLARLDLVDLESSDTIAVAVREIKVADPKGTWEIELKVLSDPNRSSLVFLYSPRYRIWSQKGTKQGYVPHEIRMHVSDPTEPKQAEAAHDQEKIASSEMIATVIMLLTHEAVTQHAQIKCDPMKTTQDLLRVHMLEALIASIRELSNIPNQATEKELIALLYTKLNGKIDLIEDIELRALLGRM